MKKTIIIILVTAIVTTIILFFTLEFIAQKDQLNADTIEKIDSKILSESREILVHLPKNYHKNTETTYPVIIALDGTSHDQDLANASSILNSARVLRDVIIIGIPNANRNRDLTPEYLMRDDDPTEMGKGDNFLNFLEKEVLPLIDKNYRTNGYRIISGHSRAGMFCFYSLMEKPDLFDGYFCFSPAFWRNNNKIVEKMNSFLADNNSLNAFVFMSLGSEENQKMKNSFSAMKDIIEESPMNGLKFHSRYTEGATHGTNAYLSIPLALSIWNSEYEQ